MGESKTGEGKSSEKLSFRLSSIYQIDSCLPCLVQKHLISFQREKINLEIARGDKKGNFNTNTANLMKIKKYFEL